MEGNIMEQNILEVLKGVLTLEQWELVRAHAKNRAMAEMKKTPNEPFGGMEEACTIVEVFAEETLAGK